MTEEELKAALEQEKANTAALTEAAAASVKQISDLTAERDSLKEELTATKEAYDKIQVELQDTKKLNFTLARTIDQGKGPEASPEELMRDMFLGGAK